jgi:hypothetical protein
MKKRRATPRRAAHISDGGRAFLPQARISEIRWEESLARAAAKRLGVDDPVLVHLNCHCGSIGCLGVPVHLPESKEKK